MIFYGSAFQRAHRGDLGGGDLLDIIHGVRLLIDSGYVDSQRIGIAGDSYCGFLTMIAIGKYPDPFAAAVETFGVSDRGILARADPLWREYPISLLEIRRRSSEHTSRVLRLSSFTMRARRISSCKARMT